MPIHRTKNESIQASRGSFFFFFFKISRSHADGETAEDPVPDLAHWYYI